MQLLEVFFQRCRNELHLHGDRGAYILKFKRIFFHIISNNLMIIICLFKFKKTDEECMLMKTTLFVVRHTALGLIILCLKHRLDTEIASSY